MHKGEQMKVAWMGLYWNILQACEFLALLSYFFQGLYYEGGS